MCIWLIISLIYGTIINVATPTQAKRGGTDLGNAFLYSGFCYG